jgi:hypothetical protein
MPQCTPTQNNNKKKKKKKHYLYKEKPPAIKFPVIVPHAQLLGRQRWTGLQFEVKLGVVVS